MRLRVLRRADEDLANVLLFGTERFGFDGAWMYAQDMRRVLDLLVAQPRLGREVPNLKLGLRLHMHRAHAIFYRVDPDEIVIVRVLHGSQDFPRHFR